MPFRYLKDPLFLTCLAVYCTNRWLVKPCFPNTFSQSYLNDLICLPFWLPIMLFLMRWTGLRKDDAAPSGAELIVPLLLWSVGFELVLPQLQWSERRATCDHLDILCYTIGTAIAALVWRHRYPPVKVGSPPP
jgi:hypothetical protein